MYLSTIAAIGISMVTVGLFFSLFLGYIAYERVATKEDTVKAYLIVVILLIAICGLPIVCVLFKPLTVVTFGWNKTLAVFLGYLFHATIITIGATTGALKRHDVI